MTVDLSEEQIRYIMSKVEADVVAGNQLADSVERELDLALMDDEKREMALFLERVRRFNESVEALASLAGRR